MIVALDGKRTPASSKGTRRQHARIIERFSVDEPRYLLGQVAFAAGVSGNLLKAWVARKIIPMGEHDREAHGKGSARVFTFRRALAIGLAAELVRLGVSAAEAGRLGTRAVEVGLFASKDKHKPLVVDLLAIYPTEGGTSIDVAAWNFTIKAMLIKRAPRGRDVTSFILLSARAIAENVLERLGELE